MIIISIQIYTIIITYLLYLKGCYSFLNMLYYIVYRYISYINYIWYLIHISHLCINYMSSYICQFYFIFFSQVRLLCTMTWYLYLLFHTSCNYFIFIFLIKKNHLVVLSINNADVHQNLLSDFLHIHKFYGSITTKKKISLQYLDIYPV